MKYKNIITKKRLLNLLFIKTGLIKAGNDNPQLKKDIVKITKKINKLSI